MIIASLLYPNSCIGYGVYSSSTVHTLVVVRGSGDTVYSEVLRPNIEEQ